MVGRRDEVALHCGLGWGRTLEGTRSGMIKYDDVVYN